MAGIEPGVQAVQVAVAPDQKSGGTQKRRHKRHLAGQQGFAEAVAAAAHNPAGRSGQHLADVKPPNLEHGRKSEHPHGQDREPGTRDQGAPVQMERLPDVEMGSHQGLERIQSHGGQDQSC